MAYELSQLLFTLVEYRDNPRVDAALDLMDGVIDELDELGAGKQSAHSLRLVVMGPQAAAAEERALAAERAANGMRAFLSTPRAQEAPVLQLVDGRFRP
jgi:hypothetical protein